VPLPGAAADAVRAAVAAHAHDLDPTALRPDDFDGSGYDHSLTVGMLDGWLSADTVAATVMAA